MNEAQQTVEARTASPVQVIVIRQAQNPPQPDTYATANGSWTHDPSQAEQFTTVRLAQQRANKMGRISGLQIVKVTLPQSKSVTDTGGSA